MNIQGNSTLFKKSTTSASDTSNKTKPSSLPNSNVTNNYNTTTATKTIDTSTNNIQHKNMMLVTSTSTSKIKSDKTSVKINDFIPECKTDPNAMSSYLKSIEGLIDPNRVPD